MADAYIGQAKKRQLELLMERLGIKEADIEEKFILGSGKGGQKLNKTSSCVYIKHIPSGIEVKSQKSRSRDSNRFLARRELCERVEEQVLGEKSKRRQEIERIRRQKRRRSRRQKERMLEKKRHQSEKKGRRVSVKLDGD